MSTLCQRCGIGCRAPGTPCDWCAAPTRRHLPLGILARRTLVRSRLAAAFRRRGALMTGMLVGIVLHLAVAGIGAAAGLPGLWEVGFLWSEQWWWSLVPEAAQPWLFAAARGAAYGALAGWVFRRSGVQVFRCSGVQALRIFVGSGSPATWTALAALVLSAADTQLGTQYSLLAAALGAAVGRVTTWVMRGSRS